jgi:hypothetical protein
MPNLPPSATPPDRTRGTETGLGTDWEVPALVVALDPGIPGRLLASHPAEGWCYGCRANAPCSMRLLAETAAVLPPERLIRR